LIVVAVQHSRNEIAATALKEAQDGLLRVVTFFSHPTAVGFVNTSIVANPHMGAGRILDLLHMS
jgi:hypothetical protein